VCVGAQTCSSAKAKIDFSIRGVGSLIYADAICCFKNCPGGHMKSLTAIAIALSIVLTGCVVAEPPHRGDNYEQGRGDRDGARNRGDRDGDGVRNSQDRRPDDSRRY
jgi:hypothetical protein